MLRQVSYRQETYRAVRAGYGFAPAAGKRKFGVFAGLRGISEESGRMRRRLALALSLALAPICGGAGAEPTHGLAMHGAPALAPDFDHLPYADPAAPKGGRLVLGELGGFDSLNPYILKGRSVWAVRGLMVESLLARSWDEPFTLYGQLAGRVETPPDRSWVEFELREEARFSDGSPVTPEDVIWSMEVLAEKGLPGFRSSWDKVSRTEVTGPRSVRFHFDAPDREMPLIIGLRPILKKAAFEGRDFAESSMEPLVTSGPYVVESAEPGRRVVFRKDPDWWGADLPLNAGLWNLDEIRYEWFKDESARFEAFRAGDIDVFRDGDPDRWAEGYGFPAAERGDVTRAEIPHQRPSGLTGFVFNTRRDLFKDVRVRQALAEAFDFEWINNTLNRGAYARIRSPFGGTPLGFEGAAEGAEREILAPFAEDLPEGALGSDFAWPETDGEGRSRRNLRKAARLLAEAGWQIQNGVLMGPERKRFRFEILLSGPAWEPAAQVFAKSLSVLGIQATVRLGDGAQYQARRSDYDYDMIVNTWAMSLSPGNEQRFYWGREGVTAPGTRNYPGVDSPAAEAAIDALLAAEDPADFQAAARALDRVLTTGIYVIPLWHAPTSRIAYWKGLGYPERLPLYGDWSGWLPDVWWRAE